MFNEDNIITKEQMQKQEAEQKAQQLKLDAFKGLDVTVIKNGLRFHTDDKSMVDLMSADRSAERQGGTDESVVDWKTADGLKEVTIGNIREAIDTRLANKGNIVGVNG